MAEADAEAEKEAAAADKAASDADAAAANLQTANKQKEEAASAKEVQAFANADEKLKIKQQEADQVYASTNDNADQKLAEAKAVANAKYLKAVEIIKRTAVKEKLEASEKKKASYLSADNARAEAYKVAQANLVAAFKSAENKRRRSMQRLKDTLNEENSLHLADKKRKIQVVRAQVETRTQEAERKANSAKARASISKQKAFERAALDVNLSGKADKKPSGAMLNLVEEFESGAGGLTSQALKLKHASEAESDRTQANDMIASIERNVKSEIMQRQEQAATSMEQDQLQIADESLKKKKLQIDERNEAEIAAAESTKEAGMEKAERQYRFKRDKLIMAANAAKLKATEEKDATYGEAGKIWKQLKEKARAAELDAFRSIEEQQANKLKRAKDEQEAAIAAAKADREAKKKAAREAKARAFAAASETLARAKAAATQAKAAAMQALAAERAAADQQIKPAIADGGPSE